MITRLKVYQLEKRFNSVQRGKGPFVVRDITKDGRLLDKNDYVLTDQEVERIKKEDMEIHQKNGTVVLLLSYSKPKMKPGSATIPYHVNPYKG